MMSCNGCRILRRECNENCILRPCIEWIKCPNAQANATFLLAKTYGRVGLINLIGSAPKVLRPEVFKSLLHDACGRLIEPIHGAVGLERTGYRALCENAVTSVLRGEPVLKFYGTKTSITQIVHVNNYTIHNIANEANINNCEPFGTVGSRQPHLVNYFDIPHQTLNFEVGSSSSSNDNNNNEVMLDLSLGLKPYKATTIMPNNNI